MNFLIAIALLAISYAITALTSKGPPKPPDPAQYKDFKLPVPQEGAPQPVIFGDCWTSDWQVLWYGNLTSEAIDGSGGGKK